MKIRKAVLHDAPRIQALVNFFAERDWMLPRSLSYLYENIRDFWVAERGEEIIGCAALHVDLEGLAEVKSLAVKESQKGRGVGRELVRACLAEARNLGVTRVFALTYLPDFFKKCGFSRYDKSKLPHKVWRDCLNCHKFPDCNEVSVAVEIKKSEDRDG